MASTTPPILVNGQPISDISVSDRGLSYGHGVFETIRIAHQQSPLWELHMARLQRGCVQLKINLPENIETTLHEEVLRLVKSSQQGQAIIKITITAGLGRGYVITSDQECQRIVALYPLPEYPQSLYEAGVEVRTCGYRLPKNKYLAGLKHLNRLDQVIARSEWTDDNIFEGIMLDEQDNVIEGVMSNVFAYLSGELVTPDLSYAGVRGTMRDYVLGIASEQGINIAEVQLSERELFKAEELFVCNSVMGVVPINKWGEQRYKVGPITKILQGKIKQLFLDPGR